MACKLMIGFLVPICSSSFYDAPAAIENTKLRANSLHGYKKKMQRKTNF
jgi:hypothetical protein